MSSNKSITICITGPESSGKSTLARAFNSKKDIKVISEYAREYMANLTREYDQSDLELMAKEQLRLMRSSDSEITILDTGVEVIKLWNDEKFTTSLLIEKLLKEQLNLVDAYWLCKPDMPWEPDPLRENPEDRMRLFNLYQRLLDKLGVSYLILEGAHKVRLSAALANLEHKKTLS